MFGRFFEFVLSALSCVDPCRDFPVSATAQHGLADEIACQFTGHVETSRLDQLQSLTSTPSTKGKYWACSWLSLLVSLSLECIAALPSLSPISKFL